MSTAITSSQTATFLPKTDDHLKPIRLHRSPSIDAIKKINTYICSPESYMLPAIFSTWLKTGQNGLQSSTEKTIFMFRSVIFGSFIVKFLLGGGNVAKMDAQTVIAQIAAVLWDKLSRGLRNKLVVAMIFKVAVTYLVVQLTVCVVSLCHCMVPLGLGFLMLCLGYIVVLGHRINRYHYGKRDVKVKVKCH